MFDNLILNRVRRYIRIKTQNYKIIPLGQYCLPRVASTLSGLKPPKNSGELTCPFDLAFFDDIDSISFLLENEFETFFDDINFDPEKKYYISKNLHIRFNHDGKLSLHEFRERYEKRIVNFYKYVALKRKVVFIHATSFALKEASVFRLYNVLCKIRG